MSNELLSLSTIFQERLFRIPDYQRGYAWQRSQLEDFWEDLYNLGSNRNHYTGMISLKAINPNTFEKIGNDRWLLGKNYSFYHVIDGQQRLTTIIILINEIIVFVRNLEDNKGKSDSEIYIGYESLESIIKKYIYQQLPPRNLVTSFIFGYENDNSSDVFFRNRILEVSNIGDVVDTYYTRNLEYAKKFFKDSISLLFEEEKMSGIVNIYTKLTQRMKFNLYEISDDFDVFVTFETMNNRGKKLTNLELLKNRLIYIVSAYDDKTLKAEEKIALREQIDDAWTKIYAQMGRNSSSALPDDEYLRAHWIIYFTYTRKRGDDYIEYLLNKFSAKNVYEKRTIMAAEESFEENVSILSDYYDEIEGDDDPPSDTAQLAVKLDPDEISNYVDSLRTLSEYWYDSFFPYENENLTEDEKIWIERLTRIGINYFRPLVVVALYKKTSADETVALFKAIERFIFAFFKLASYRAYYQNPTYNRKAREIYHGTATIKEVTEKLNKAVDDNQQVILNFFVTDIKNKFDGGNKEGYYSWAALKYFMYEYEFSLGSARGIKKIDWKMFSKSEKDKVSIEHILPQDHSNDYWISKFSEYINNESEMAVLKGSLGNLLPLAQSINSSLQNDSFDEKKTPTKPGRTGYSTGSYSELEVAQKDEWNAECIHERTIKLLSFMETRWGIGLTEQQKLDLSYDSFISEKKESSLRTKEDDESSIEKAT